MRKLFLLVYFICFSCLLACQPEITTKSALLQYLKNEDNGLLKNNQKDAITTSATYVPAQILLERERDQGKETDATKKSRMCFVIRFSKDGKELLSQIDLNLYSDLIQTLSFRMIPLVSLRLDNNKLISPIDCLFQQTYGLSSSNELLVIFDADKVGNSKKYRLSVDEFGMGLGQLRYDFSKNDIDQLNNRLKI